MESDGEQSTASATAAVAPAASFGALNQIDAGVLSVGYAEVGPPDGTPVILLHGWPYDIHTYVDVAPLLAAKGYRVIVPSLRGYGSTRFLSPGAARNGQQAAIAVDVIALMDALKIDRAMWRVATGARERRTSLRRCGRSAAKPSCR
jgi:alpha-beta hydrolase superfamily lysophospholipase